MKISDLGYQLAGWTLFVLCAACFIVSSVQHGDLLALVGSAIFLVACIVFLVPLIREASRTRDGPRASDGSGSHDPGAADRRRPR